MNIDKIKERIKFFKQHEVIVSQTEEVEYLLAEIDRLTDELEKEKATNSWYRNYRSKED